MFLQHYANEEWHCYRQKACRKKEMDFLAAYIKSVNQQVNKQEDIKLLEKAQKHGIYIHDITCKDAQLHVYSWQNTHVKL